MNKKFDPKNFTTNVKFILKKTFLPCSSLVKLEKYNFD